VPPVGKPPFFGLLRSAGTALTRAHTIRRFCGAKEKEPRAARLGASRCGWPSRYGNQGRHLRSRKEHPLARGGPLPGAPGYGVRARSRAAHLASADSRIHLAKKTHDVATGWHSWRANAVLQLVASKRRPSTAIGLQVYFGFRTAVSVRFILHDSAEASAAWYASTR